MAQRRWSGSQVTSAEEQIQSHNHFVASTEKPFRNMGFVVLGRQSCEPGSSNIDHKVRQGTNPLLAVVTAQ